VQLKRQFVITEFESQEIREVQICSVSFVLVARKQRYFYLLVQSAKRTIICCCSIKM